MKVVVQDVFHVMPLHFLKLRKNFLSPPPRLIVLDHEHVLTVGILAQKLAAGCLAIDNFFGFVEYPVNLLRQEVETSEGIKAGTRTLYKVEQDVLGSVLIGRLKSYLTHSETISELTHYPDIKGLSFSTMAPTKAKLDNSARDFSFDFQLVLFHFFSEFIPDMPYEHISIGKSEKHSHLLPLSYSLRNCSFILSSFSAQEVPLRETQNVVHKLGLSFYSPLFFVVFRPRDTNPSRLLSLHCG